MYGKRSAPRNIGSSGALVQVNVPNGFAIFTGYDLKPSDVRSAKITIANAGSRRGTFRLFEVEASNSFRAGELALLIEDEFGAGRLTEIYRGVIGDFPLDGIDLGLFEPGEEHTYRFTVTLTADASNDGQAHGAGAIYEWGEESDGNVGR